MQQQMQQQQMAPEAAPPEVAMQQQAMQPQIGANGGPLYGLGGILESQNEEPTVNRYDFGSWLKRVNPELYKQYSEFEAEKARYVAQKKAENKYYEYIYDEFYRAFDYYHFIVEDMIKNKERFYKLNSKQRRYLRYEIFNLQFNALMKIK